MTEHYKEINYDNACVVKHENRLRW